MPTDTFTVVVNRPAADVFAYLTDFSKHAEWSPKPYRVESITEGPTRVGTKLHSVGWLPGQPEHGSDAEVTDLDPPSKFAFNAVEQGQIFRSEFILTPEGSATRVDRIFSMPKPPGFVGVVFPLIRAMIIKPGVRKGMNMLKANLESNAA
jgi:uncharacterized protein YndB with AHSA1/START domain